MAKFGVWHSSWWTSDTDERREWDDWKEADAFAKRMSAEWPGEHFEYRKVPGSDPSCKSCGAPESAHDQPNSRILDVCDKFTLSEASPK
jgi:hypothetical protein